MKLFVFRDEKKKIVSSEISFFLEIDFRFLMIQNIINHKQELDCFIFPSKSKAKNKVERKKKKIRQTS